MSKSPNPIDIHVGARVRLRRMMIGMSQEKLGESLGLTFQQVQKYEKGANRIGASRLLTIASILDVPIEFLFEDMPKSVTATLPSGPASSKSDDDVAPVMEFVASREGLDLNSNFSRIESPAKRKALVDFVKTLT